MKGQAILVQLVDGSLITTIISESADLVAAMELRGFPFAGENSRRRLRPELQGAPTFKGVNLCWGGEDHPLRYETQAAYDVLSM